MPPPLVPPPTSDIGAMTVPRYLQRWLDVNAITHLTRTSTFISLPAFTQSISTWSGYSDIIYAFNFESPNVISLKGYTYPVSSNYTLCVSYQIQGVVTRYILWYASGTILPGSFPLYNGQPLKKNFRFEIWNTSQGAVNEPVGATFYTSKLGPFDYRYGSDSTLVNPDPIVTNFQNNNTNPTIALPLNVISDWYAGTGIINQGANYVTTWTDSYRGQVLTPGVQGAITGATSNNVGGLSTIDPSPIVQIPLTNFDISYLTTSFISNQVVILMQISGNGAGQIYSSGTGGLTISLTQVGGTRYFNAYGTTGVYPITSFGIGSLFYLLIADSFNGVLYVINPLTGARLDTIVGTPINPNTGVWTVLGPDNPPNPNPPSNPNELVTGGTSIVTGGQPILTQ